MFYKGLRDGVVNHPAYRQLFVFTVGKPVITVPNFSCHHPHSCVFRDRCGSELYSTIAIGIHYLLHDSTFGCVVKRPYTPYEPSSAPGNASIPINHITAKMWRVHFLLGFFEQTHPFPCLLRRKSTTRPIARIILVEFPIPENPMCNTDHQRGLPTRRTTPTPTSTSKSDRICIWTFRSVIVQ